MTALLALNHRFWPLVTALILAAITVLSLTPLPELPLRGPWASDKLHHFVAYGALAFPVALARPRRWVWLLLLFAAWSGAIEIVQPYVNRHGEWADFAANTGGILLGVLAAESLRRGVAGSRP